MFNFFGNIKNTSLHILSIVLNISTLIYLVTLFGFNHINKELILNSVTGIGIILLILFIFIAIISFIFYASFKLAYKKIQDNLETLIKLKED